MKGNEVIGIGFGIGGFLFLYDIYKYCPPILNIAGEDIKVLAFGFGLLLWFVFAFVIDHENLQ